MRMDSSVHKGSWRKIAEVLVIGCVRAGTSSSRTNMGAVERWVVAQEDGVDLAADNAVRLNGTG